MTTPSTFSLTLILSLGLVACGGGGDSTSNPVATYVPGAAEQGAWTVLQGARTQCGFGALTRNAKLDQAALNHSKYLVDRSIATGVSILSHLETPGLPGFTGIYPWDRTDFTPLGTGYGTQVAEILQATAWDYVSPPTFPTMAQRGTESMRDLLNTVYHLAGAMYDGADVGFGAYMKTTQINATTWREEYRFGSLNGYQTSRITLGTHNVATYPCKDSVNIPPAFVPANEAPNPFPSMTKTDPPVGPPIYLKADEGHEITVTSVNVRQNGVSVPTTVLTHANDPNIDIYGFPYIGLHEAFVVPAIALLPSTRTEVNLQGTVKILGSINSVPFTRSFTMSTGL